MVGNEDTHRMTIRTATQGKFEVYKDRAGGYRWRLKAGNGEIVAVSESYVSLTGAASSARKVTTWATNAPITFI